MLELTREPGGQQQATNWRTLAESLGQQFVKSETRADRSDLFVADNFTTLKSSGLIAAGVPKELGGGGASYADLCDILRILGSHCSSTALAFSMHTHQVMVMAWKWQHQNASVDGLLKRIANEQLVLLSSGGSDWLQGSGTAERVEGGFLINGRKVFASGAPAGNLLMTSAVYQDPDAGPTVLHFALPMKASGVTIEPTWEAMGMRGTASHDILISNVFVPDQAIALRREQNKWHPAFHLIAMIALPLIYSVYVGVARAARDLAVEKARKRSNDLHLCSMVGSLDNELTAAQLALQHMISTAVSSQPGFQTTNQVLTGRTLVARSVLEVVNLAMEVAGGRSFYRSFGLEKLFRDAQGARYHPLRKQAQQQLSGQIALGWDLAAL